jgi:hypothetical protein
MEAALDTGGRQLVSVREQFTLYERISDEAVLGFGRPRVERTRLSACIRVHRRFHFLTAPARKEKSQPPMNADERR